MQTNISDFFIFCLVVNSTETVNGLSCLFRHIQCIFDRIRYTEFNTRLNRSQTAGNAETVQMIKKEKKMYILFFLQNKLAIDQLWNSLGDLRQSMTVYIIKIVARWYIPTNNSNYSRILEQA